MKKILLVEDDMYIRDVTATRLMEHSYEVLTAANGEDAMELLSETIPELILLDLDLPDIHGFQVLKELRADAKLSRVPVIVFTNNDAPELIEQALKGGAKDFFTKASTDFDQMLEVIERNLV